jgi:hypothetical protein
MAQVVREEATMFGSSEWLLDVAERSRGPSAAAMVEGCSLAFKMPMCSPCKHCRFHFECEEGQDTRASSFAAFLAEIHCSSSSSGCRRLCELSA